MDLTCIYCQSTERPRMLSFEQREDTHHGHQQGVSRVKRFAPELTVQCLSCRKPYTVYPPAGWEPTAEDLVL